MNFQKMTKKQLEAHGRKNGVELDHRKSKKDMIVDLNKAPAKKPVAKKAVAKKAPSVIVKKPQPTMPSKPPTYVAPKLSFFDKVKKYFNL